MPMKRRVSVFVAGFLLLISALVAQHQSIPRPQLYSQLMHAGTLGGCAGQVVRMIESVNRARILRPSESGKGEIRQTIVIVELTGNGTLAEVTTAVEDA